MPVVACTACQSRLKVPDNMAGRKAKCPKCQAIFDVPADEVALAPPPPATPAPTPVLRTPTRSGRTMEDVLGGLNEPQARRKYEDEPEEEQPRHRYDDDREEERPRRERSDYDDLDEDRPRRRRKKEQASSIGLILGIVGGVVGLIVVIVVIVVLVQVLGTETGTRSFSLNRNDETSWHIQFKGNHRVDITVTSTGISDVDLFVYDSSDRLVVEDQGDSPNCHVQFVPPTTQTYKVKVWNRVRAEPELQGRNKHNSGTLKFKETAPQAGGNLPPQGGKDFKEGPPGGGAVTPLVGGVVTGRITQADADPRAPGRFAKVYTRTLNANQLYTINLNSNDFDAYLRLEDSNGNVLAEDDDGGGNRNSRIAHRPTVTGTYRIVATSLAGVDLGAYTLRIQP